MRIIIRALIVTSLLAVPGASLAADAQDRDSNNAHAEIMRGDFAIAERQLTEARRVFPDDADLMLNLALVYANTGRASAARSLYRSVLDRPDEDLLLAHDRHASAHALAKLGLSRLDRIQLSAR